MKAVNQIQADIYTIYLLHHKPTDAHVARKRYILKRVSEHAKTLYEKEQEKSQKDKSCFLSNLCLKIQGICNNIKRYGTISSNQCYAVVNFINYNMIGKGLGFHHSIPNDEEVEKWHFKRSLVSKMHVAKNQVHPNLVQKEFYKIASEMWELKQRISELEKEAETVIGHNPMEEVKILLPQ